jgi:rod shape-determining protein MreC
MESVLGRYRNLTILVGVLFMQVLGLAVQVKRSGDPQNTRLIRIWAVDAITPLERACVRLQDDASQLWRNYFYLRGVRSENHQLKEQIEQMRLDEVRLTEDAAQARRLQSLLGFKEQFIAKTVAAQVIGSGGSDLSRIIYIDKGSDNGIAPDMAVITAAGIVGKVLEVFPGVSKVLLINDQSSGAGALLEKSRLQGVLRGTPNGELVLDHVMSDEQVAPGEKVLSSGGDQIFPKGLLVGTVTRVSPGREMFLDIKVKPAADLNRLEEVLVVTEKQQQPPLANNGARVRAADILAQRLPSVPERPAAVASAASIVPGMKTPAATPAPKPATNGALKPLAGNTAKTAAVPGAENNQTVSNAINTANVAAQTATPKSATTSKPAQSHAAPGSPVSTGALAPNGASSQSASSKPATPQSRPATPPVVQSSDSQDIPH